MKKIHRFIVVLSIISLFSFGCSGGGGRSDEYYLSYSITNAASTVVSSGTISAGPSDTGFDGLPACSYYPTSNDLWCFVSDTPGLVDDFYSNNDLCVHFGILDSDPISAGTYISGELYVIYSDTLVYRNFNTAGFSITITSLGGIGEPVEGSYDIAVTDGEGTSFTITGTFRLKRGPDASVLEGLRIG